MVELIDNEMYYMVIYDERYIHIFQAPLLFEILYKIKDRKQGSWMLIRLN